MSESCGSLRKRLLDEAADVEDLVQQKSRRSDVTESDSSGTSSSSSSSTLLSSDDEQTESDTALSEDVPIPFGLLQDSLQFQSQDDALKC